MSVRAVRNNNPGNIRVGQKWRGLMPDYLMTPEQAAEKSFCVFETPADGFRAMAVILGVYHKKHGVTTLRGVIARWAPPTENNTGAYLNDVCNRLRRMPDAPFEFLVPAAVQELCHAISVHECGGWFFRSADLVAGVNAAFTPG